MAKRNGGNGRSIAEARYGQKACSLLFYIPRTSLPVCKFAISKGCKKKKYKVFGSRIADYYTLNLIQHPTKFFLGNTEESE